MQLFSGFRDWNIRYKILAIAIGAIGVIGAVFFASGLDNLFRFFGGRAAGEDELTWKQAPAMNQARSHQALTPVSIGADKYIYALGGITNLSAGQPIQFLDTVERIKLDGNGKPTGSWNSVASMNFARADFKAIQAGDYLYAVVGHISTLPDNTAANQKGLPFSTIERMKLTDASPRWDVVATVMNVHFSPEVTLFNNEIHITGGIFGRPEHFTKYAGGTATPGQVTAIGGKPNLPGGSLSYTVPQAPNITGGGITLGNCDTLRSTLIGQVQSGAKSPAQAASEYAAAGCGVFDFTPYDSGTGIIVRPDERETTGTTKSSVPEGESQSQSQSMGTQTEVESSPEPTPLVQTPTLSGPEPTVVQPAEPAAESKTVSFWGKVMQPWINEAMARMIPPAEDLYIPPDINNPPVLILPLDPRGSFTAAVTGNSAGALRPNGHRFFTTVETHIVIQQPNTVVPVFKTGRLVIDDTLENEFTGTFDAITYTAVNYNPKIDFHGIKLIAHDFFYQPWYEFYGNSTLRRTSVYFNPIQQGRVGHAVFPYESNNRNSGIDLTILGGQTVTSVSGWMNNPANGSSSWYMIQNDYSFAIEDTEVKSLGYDSASCGPTGYNLSRCWKYNTHIGLSARLNGGNYIWDRSNETNTSNLSKAMKLDSWMTLPLMGQGVEHRGRAFHQVVVTSLRGKVDQLNVIGGIVNNPLYDRGQGGTYPNNIFFLSQWTVNRLLGTSQLLLGTEGYEDTPDSDRALMPINEVATYSASGSWRKYPASFSPRSNFPVFMLAKDQSLLMLGGNGDQYTSVYGQGINANWKYTGFNDIDTGFEGEWDTTADAWKSHNGSSYVYAGTASSIQSYPDGSKTITYFMAGGLAGGEVREHGTGSATTAVDYFGPFTTDGGSQGVPDATASTVEADPMEVLANGQDTSTVTVTLKDINGIPVTDKWVAVKTPRAGDTVTPLAVQAGADGTYQLDLSSTNSTAPNSPARFYIFWGNTEAEAKANAQNDVSANRLDQYAPINFIPGITLLDPSQGSRGEKFEKNPRGEEVRVRAFGTHFRTGTGGTSVVFTKPSILNFSASKESLVASGKDISVLTAAITGTPNLSGQQVTFSFVDAGSGRFKGDDGRPTADPVIRATNGSGIATVDFLSGTTPGIQKVKAAVTVSGTRYEKTLILIQNKFTDSNPYVLDLSVSPAEISGTQGSFSTVKATLLLGGTGFGGKTVNFISDSMTDSFSQTTVTTKSTDPGKGEAITSFTVGNNSPSGKVKVVAYVQIDSNNFVAAVAHITKRSVPGDDSLTVSNLVITSATELYFDLSVGDLAALGGWDMQVITPNVPDSQGNRLYTEVVSLPGFDDFEVIGDTPPVGARLLSIDPNSMERGEELEVTIRGNETNFLSGKSQVIFTSAPGNNNPGVESNGIEVVSVSVQDTTSLTAQLRIHPQARFGFWNVRVMTEHGNWSEVAELPGDRDVFVTVPDDGYFLDLTANPTTVRPNGSDTSTITGVAGKFHNNPDDPGQWQPLQVPVTFTVLGGGNIERTTVTTDTLGRLTNKYTADTVSGVAVVGGQYSTNGHTVTGAVSIAKLLEDSKVQFTLTADPTTLTIGGGQVTSKLTAILKYDGVAQANKDVTFVLTSGTGSISPATKKTDSTGKVEVSYIADQVAGNASIKATAVIDQGAVESNAVTITKEQGEMVTSNLVLTVPLEARPYDALVAVYVRAENSGEAVLSEIGTLDGNNLVQGLPNIDMTPGVKYFVWVKAPNHKARIKEFVAPESGAAAVAFETLEIADIAGTDNTGFEGFHDNDINGTDLDSLAAFFGEDPTGPVADFNLDGKVNFYDIVYMLKNFGKGANKN